MKHVKKQSGIVVDFDANKLENSIFKNFTSNHYPKKEATHYTKKIENNIHKWLDKKTVITTVDIRAKVSSELELIDPAVALSYKKHKHLW